MTPEEFDEFHDDAAQPDTASNEDTTDNTPRARLAFAASPFLTAAREKELWSRRDDPTAKAEILTAHIPLGKRIAREAFLMSQGAALSLEDFDSEALLEMTVSYDKYIADNEWGARFSTYVAPRIKHALLDLTIRQGGPVKMATTKEQRSLFAHWRDCNRIAVSEDPDRTNYQRILRISELMAERTSFKSVDPQTIIDFEARHASRGISLNTPRSCKKDPHAVAGLEFQDMIVSHLDEPDQALENGRDAERTTALMKAALTSLDDRARDIIEQRILAEDGEGKTLHELAADYGVSAERIRQIEVKALQKMRSFMEGGAPEIHPAVRRTAKPAHVPT